MRTIYQFSILILNLFIGLQESNALGVDDVTGLFDSEAQSYPEDTKMGPNLFKNGKTRKPHGGDREAMLMVTKGNMENYFTNFTGYFVGFEYYAMEEAPINLQLYKLSRYTNSTTLLGYYQLVAETGFFTAGKGKHTQFFDQSITLRSENVIVGIKYKEDGNPIPYKKDRDCSNTALYSKRRTVESTTSVYEDVHFTKNKCHKYALRGILLETNYASDCAMYIAPSESVVFIQSHTDFGVSYYPNDYYKCWIIRAESKAEEVRVESAVFEVEKGDGGSCVYDRVRIYTIKWITESNPKRLQTRCGSNRIKELSTDGENYMFVTFETDQSYAFNGFYIGASSFQIFPYSYLTIGIAVGVVAAVLIIIAIVIIVICYRKKHSKKQPELIISEKEAIVESDKEDEEDDYMINKAPLSTALPATFLNRGRLQVGGSTRPIQPMLVKPTESDKPLPLSLQLQRPLVRRQTVDEYSPVAPAQPVAAPMPRQPAGAPMPRQPAGAPKLANFVTAIMTPGSVNVKGKMVTGMAPGGMVVAGIASQDAGLNKPMEPDVSAAAPDLSRFKSLWKKALIPGPARYITPHEWTRPWARPLETVQISMETQPQATPRKQVRLPPPPGVQPPPQAPSRVKLPPGFVPGGRPLVPAPRQQPGAQADAAVASVAFPQLYSVVKQMDAANDPVHARSMWKKAAAVLPGPAKYLNPDQWQRPWAMTSNKNPRFKPKFMTVAPTPPADGRSKSVELIGDDALAAGERPHSASSLSKRSKVAPAPPTTNDKKALLDSDSPRSCSSATRSGTPPTSSDESTAASQAEMLPKVHLKGTGSSKGQSEC